MYVTNVNAICNPQNPNKRQCVEVIPVPLMTVKIKGKDNQPVKTIVWWYVLLHYPVWCISQLRIDATVL